MSKTVYWILLPCKECLFFSLKNKSSMELTEKTIKLSDFRDPLQTFLF